MINPLQHRRDTHGTARALPGAARKLSSDEAKHPAITTQQGLKVKHLLDAFMHDIEKGYVCQEDASLNLKRRLLRHNLSPGELHTRDKPLRELSRLRTCISFFSVFGAGQMMLSRGG